MAMIFNTASFDTDGFSYNPENGQIAKHGKRRDVPDSAGHYYRITNGAVHVKAHRLAWRLYYGWWPECEVDHVNRDKRDNRITNLRLATHSQNRANRSAHKHCQSGERGVYWCNQRKQWKIQLRKNGKAFQAFARHKISAIVGARLIRRILHGEFGAYDD